MDYINSTSFPSLSFDALDAQSGEHHVAVLRVTHTIAPDGSLKIAPEQTPLRMVDEYYGEPNRSSVKEECDLSPYKPWCDVIVNGNASAPDNRPVPQFESGIRITRKGNPVVHKKIMVSGPRYWRRRFSGGWTLTDPLPIQSLPLRYEYAYGGECRIEAEDPAARKIKAKNRLSAEQRTQHPDGLEKAPVAHTCCFANPIGRGYAERWYLKAKKLNSVPAPQIESPLNLISKFGASYVPQGLGVIGRAWGPRLELCGTLDNAFVQSRKPLPEDFDETYWNGAHPDLQVPWLQGDETIDLINIHIPGFRDDRTDSHHNRIKRLTLPGHKVCGLVTYDDGHMAVLDFRLDTLVVNANQETVSTVYRLRVLAEPGIEKLDVLFMTPAQRSIAESHCETVTAKTHQIQEAVNG